MANPMDLGGLSPEDYIKRRGWAKPGDPPPVPPPPQAQPAEGEGYQLPEWAGRYGRAALMGVGTAAPFAAGAQLLPGLGQGAALPILASGALGGIASQAAEDLFPGTWWAPPLAGMAAGFGVGGAPAAVGAVRRALGSSVAHIAVGDVIANLLTGTGHIPLPTIESLEQQAATLGAGALALPVVKGIGEAIRNPSDFIYPIIGGASSIPVNTLGGPATAPIPPPPPRRSTLELSPDQPSR